MTPQERIEEAHGLWELAVQRVAALAEAIVSNNLVHGDLLREAVAEERKAFAHWQQVSKLALTVATVVPRATPKGTDGGEG